MLFSPRRWFERSIRCVSILRMCTTLDIEADVPGCSKELQLYPVNLFRLLGRFLSRHDHELWDNVLLLCNGRLFAIFARSFM